MSFSFKKELKSVVSKALVNQIVSFVDEIIQDVGPDFTSDAHRQSVAQMIEEFLSETAMDGSIVQYKAMCDRRNNKAENMTKGEYHLAVLFRQKNCLITTQILYTINCGPAGKTKDYTWVI